METTIGIMEKNMETTIFYKVILGSEFTVH